MDNNFVYEIENGEVIILDYKDKTVESIDIPEFIEGLPVTKISDWVFFDCDQLLYITIPKSVINISYSILFACESLNRINNVEIINDYCIINNKFIYDCESISMIIHQISDDYYVSFSDSVDSTENYYIEHLLYDKEFKS